MYGKKGIHGEAPFVPKKMMAFRSSKNMMLPNEKPVLGVVQEIDTNKKRLEKANRLEKMKS